MRVGFDFDFGLEDAPLPSVDRATRSAEVVSPSGTTEATIRATIAQLKALLPERSLTIRELYDRHELTLPRDMPWVGSMRSTMKRFLARCGHLRVSAFGPTHWEDYRDAPEIKGHYSVTTRNVQLSRLQAALNWAVATGRIPFNPIAKVKKEKPRPKRETEVSREDEAELLKILDPKMRAAVLIAVDGGMRRNEVRLLKWEDIDFVKRTAVLHAANTKTKRHRTVRLTSRAIDAIQVLPRYPGCPWLFASRHTRLPWDESSMYRRWRAAVDEMKLVAAPGDRSVRYHDLRGSCASRLARLGAPVPAIQKILGHESMATTMLYIRVNSKDVDQAYSLLEASVPPKALGPCGHGAANCAVQDEQLAQRIEVP